jgi:hypothetical protein
MTPSPPPLENFEGTPSFDHEPHDYQEAAGEPSPAVAPEPKHAR